MEIDVSQPYVFCGIEMQSHIIIYGGYIEIYFQQLIVFLMLLLLSSLFSIPRYGSKFSIHLRSDKDDP